MCHRVIRSFAFAVSSLCVTAIALASPNEASNNAEWRAWPEYCRARFIAYNHGNMDRNWERSLAPKTVEKWAVTIGEPTWTGLHHFCRGLVVMQRYRNLPRKQTPEIKAWRKSFSDSAIAEISFTYFGQPSAGPFQAVMGASFALAHHYAGKDQAALDLIMESIASHPEVVDPYSTGYVILRELGQRDKGLELLERCFKTTEGRSPENNYFLALEYLDRKQYDKARERAQKAKDLGYPLRGVERQLQALGKWQ